MQQFYNSYKLSHDLSFLLPFRNSLLRSPLATLNEPFLSFGFLCASWNSTASGSFFNLIWLSMPTRSSSTWWFKAAEVSAYLLSNWCADDLASGKSSTKCIQNCWNFEISKRFFFGMDTIHHFEIELNDQYGSYAHFGYWTLITDLSKVL